MGRVLLVIVLLAGVIAWAVYAYGGPAAPRPEAMPDDPLIADLVDTAATSVDRNRRDRELRERLAMVYAANGMEDLAQACYEQLIAMRNTPATVWHRLALLREDQGDVRGAIDAMQQALETDATHPPSHWRLGYWLLDQGKLDDAQASFEAALELERANRPALFGLAQTYLQSGKTDEAIDLLERRLTSGSHAAYANFLLVSAYRRAGKPEAALAADALADGAPPRWSDAWADEINKYRTGYDALRKRAEQLVSVGRFDDAIKLLERLRSEDGEDAPLLNMLGVAYVTQGRSERGLEILQRALELDPNNYPAVINLARAYLHTSGGSHYTLSLALAEARRAIELNPESGEAHRVLGRIHQQRGDVDAAIDAFLTAYDYDSRTLQPLYTALDLQMQAGQWDGAEETARRILRHQPHHAASHEAIITALIERDEHAAAQSALQQAVQAGVQADALAPLRDRLETSTAEQDA